MADERSFLSRWSQRKLAQQDSAEHEDMVAEGAVVEGVVAEEASAFSSDDVQDSERALSNPEYSQAPSTEPSSLEPELELTDEDMPAIETLNEQSDFSQFFSNGVSEELRDLALQRLFRLPEFNLRDGLNDYDEDFSRMTALSDAVVSQLRNWMADTEEAIKDEVTDRVVGGPDDGEALPASGLSEEHLSQEHISQEHPAQESTPQGAKTAELPYEADDLGDADLEG